MTPLEERSVTDLIIFEIQIEAELSTIAAGRRLSILLTETSLGYLFLWLFSDGDWHNILTTKGIYNYKVSDTVTGKEKVLSQMDLFLAGEGLLWLLDFSLWAFEMWNTVKPLYNTARYFTALEVRWAGLRGHVNNCSFRVKGWCHLAGLEAAVGLVPLAPVL